MALERTKKPRIQHNKNRLVFQYLRLYAFICGLNAFYSLNQRLNRISTIKDEAGKFIQWLSAFICGLNTLHRIGQRLNSASKLIKIDAGRFANRVSAFTCVHLRFNIIYSINQRLNSASKIKNDAGRIINHVYAFICDLIALITINNRFNLISLH